MYLCKTDIHTHHDDTTTYLTHNLGPLRLDGAGARPVDFHPRFMGLRHDFRNRRPRKPHVHGREPLRQTRRNPRRGDHLRLHGARIHQTADPSERENDNQSNVRPDQPPRAFTKELGVYSSERRKIATLTVRGSVTPRTKTTEELYPVDAGGGLRLASTLCTFSYIREGQQVQSAIGCINTSNRPVRLELHSKESSGLLAADYPRELAPGQTAEINLMYLNPEGAPRYGSLRDALEVRADGRGNGTLIVAHGIGIDKSPADARRTPKVQITENIIKFGPVKHNAPQQQRTFTLTNTGDGELIVRAVETGGKVATTLTPGQRIPAGSSFTAKATLDPGRQEYGVVTDFVTIITNDPTRPMRRLRATAIVED